MTDQEKQIEELSKELGLNYQFTLLEPTLVGEFLTDEQSSLRSREEDCWKLAQQLLSARQDLIKLKKEIDLLNSRLHYARTDGVPTRIEQLESELESIKQLAKEFAEDSVICEVVVISDRARCRRCKRTAISVGNIKHSQNFTCGKAQKFLDENKK